MRERANKIDHKNKRERELRRLIIRIRERERERELIRLIIRIRENDTER